MRTLALATVLCGIAAAQTPVIGLNRVVTGLEMPTDIQSPRDGAGRLFILEQRGRIRVVKGGALLPTPVLNIQSRVGCCGERGLLGLAFPPDFASKQYFYINYTNTQGDTVISRVRMSQNPDIADAGSEDILLTIAQPYPNHNGGGLVFNPKDGYLYIGTGDGGSGGDPQNNGQRTDTLLGKMLRIDTESGVSPYAVPLSNPVLNATGHRPEIWATGLRNPWRYAFDRETGDLWIADVGQNRAEEVNFQPASSRGGENYGWRRMEGLQCYPPGQGCDSSGLTMPVVEYPRSSGCSVTGGKVYRGTRWPALQGEFLYADYCSGNIWGVRSQGGSSNRLLLPGTQPPPSFSSFGEDETGELYIADQSNGTVSLITAGAPSITAAGIVNAASFGAGLVPGSLATLFGTGVASFGGIVAATAIPLPTDIAGSSVTINGVTVPLVGVATVGMQEQVNFQVPFELAGSTRATLVVRSNGQASSPIEIPIVGAQPEIFLANNIPAVTAAGGVVSPAQPAARGGFISIYATGLGAVANAPATGRAATADPLSRVIAPVEVRIGGANAPVSFAGLAPGFVGLYQVNAQVPETTTSGLVDLTITTGGASSKPVQLAVR